MHVQHRQRRRFQTRWKQSSRISRGDWTIAHLSRQQLTSGHNDSGQLKLWSFLLNCGRITVKHTGTHISKAYEDVAKDYGIERKISFRVTDNAANMRKAFSASFFSPNKTGDGASSFNQETHPRAMKRSMERKR